MRKWNATAEIMMQEFAESRQVRVLKRKGRWTNIGPVQRRPQVQGPRHILLTLAGKKSFA